APRHGQPVLDRAGEPAGGAAALERARPAGSAGDRAADPRRRAGRGGQRRQRDLVPRADRAGRGLHLRPVRGRRLRRGTGMNTPIGTSGFFGRWASFRWRFAFEIGIAFLVGLLLTMNVARSLRDSAAPPRTFIWDDYIAAVAGLYVRERDV